MSNTLAIAHRELRSFFFSAVAYVVMALFTLVMGVLFTLMIFQTDRPASMELLFTLMIFVLVPTVPAISMRLISDEINRGTMETLKTSPVNDLEMIVGKWLGALGYYAAMLVPTFAFVAVIEGWADPDYGPIVSGYVGLLLVGAMMLAIGVFASALTRYQVIAFLITTSILAVLTIITMILPGFIVRRPGPLIDLAWSARLWTLLGLAGVSAMIGFAVYAATRAPISVIVAGVTTFVGLAAAWAVVMVVHTTDLADAVAHINIQKHYKDFTLGVVDLTNIVFFLSGTTLFLVLAAVVQESRRWL